MSVDSITARLIQDTLQAVRSAKHLRASPLLDLVALSRRLTAEGLADTCEGRAALLPTWLEELTWSQLAPLRGETSPELSGRPSPNSVERLLELLAADYRANSIDREVWGALYFRYFSGSRLTMERVAQSVGVADKTLRRRIDRGHHALADLLRREELAARRNDNIPATASAYQRLVFVDDAANRSASSARDELLDVVRGNGHAMLLSREQANGLVRLPAAEFTTYRVGRIAEWGQPQYRLDERFVALSLLVDCGIESPSGRWDVQERRFTDLGEALRAVAEPAIVLLGPPGSGKSTLLRRLELDIAVDALRREGRDEASPITFLVSLNQYRAAPGEGLPDPRAWLGEQWARRFPKLPPLTDRLDAGGVVLLLDGLNEMPRAGAESLGERVEAWKTFLHLHVGPSSGNRAVVACRSLDYSAPLSSPHQLVPQVRLEPLTDEQVQEFLRRYSPTTGQALWASLSRSRLLDALRWPFFLRLLIEDAAADGQFGPGLAALFTSFVRRAARREVERDSPRFAANGLLSAGDHQQLTRADDWSTPFDLPSGGALFPGLANLAYDMQVVAARGDASQARQRLDEARSLLGNDALAEGILHAGAELGVLEFDQPVDELQFSHQLVQEYFAARRLALRPEPERVHAPWRSVEIQPRMQDVIDALPTSERLPPLPKTGWEETTLLAAEIASETESFIRLLVPHNLALAGQAANLPSVRPRLPSESLNAFRWALVARSRDPQADLRARIDAGLALGWLGDPRFERRDGPFGAYLLPPMVLVPAGAYPIGDDNALTFGDLDYVGHTPRHVVSLSPYSIGKFPVTNAEWATFLAAGGYDDDRWWDTESGRAWRRGEGAAAGMHAEVRHWLTVFRYSPHDVDALYETGQFSKEIYERWKRRLTMSEEELEQHLREIYPVGRLTEPQYWHDSRFNNPLQPVVGLCWLEARAYCCWLAAQTGIPFRLPTEVEWEAAARGADGRPYASGATLEPLAANSAELHLKSTSPVGVFVEGDTPDGVGDMLGNVIEWTSSLFGSERFQPVFAYPYRHGDGREDPNAGSATLRVVRGGSWNSSRPIVRPDFRDTALPGTRDYDIGFRLAASSAAAFVLTTGG